jgi:hypothetical protein
MITRRRGVGVNLSRAVILCGLAALATLLLALVWVEHAQAEMEITGFSTDVTSTQAGGHPDVTYKIDWTNRQGTELACNCADARVIDTHFPTGFIGNPHAIPACKLAAFSQNACSPDSQVGVLELFNGNFRQAIYNLEPHTGEPGLVGFFVPVSNTVAFVVLHGRTDSDYGLDATSAPISHFAPINTLTVRLWGVPAASVHDANRFPAGTGTGRECKPYPAGCFGPVQATVPPEPYLQNPTTCGVPLTARQSIEYYAGTVAHAEAAWPATTGCDQLTFDPSLSVTPTTNAADTPAGLDISLRAPQPQSPTAPSPSEIRNVVTTLPAGFSLTPAGANGKQACADDELSFDTEDGAHCPEFAKIGTSSLDSSALPGPIPGNIYIGRPLPGQRYRVFVTADGFGTHVKLKGNVDPDPQTGQIVASFFDLPQSPIQGVDFHFFGSERGIFETPTRCGSYPVRTTFTPWDGALEDQSSTSFVDISSGPNGTPCPGSTRPFAPRQSSGTADNTAGVFSPFTLELSRDDGDQNPMQITTRTPPGFIASLRGTSECPESVIAGLRTGAYSGRAEQDHSACTPASRIGRVMAGVGPGSRPLFVGGNVFLAGPYRGAPVSLLAVIPAVSGPYDFGTVAVRIGVAVDPITTQLTAVSDPLPQILEGVPLRIRYLQISLDRPGFTLNPTRCDPFSIMTSTFGDEDSFIGMQNHFQVANCSSLDYSPSLSLRFSGGLRGLGHPQIHAVFTTDPGEANTRGVSVTLPRGELLDNAHIGAVCSRVQYGANACPPTSQIGRAEVETPLLDTPLSGPVFLRSSSHRLPDLVMDLSGRFDVELIGRVDAVDGRLRTTFDELPDAPITRFTFDLQGGSKGLVVNSESLCRRTTRATVKMTGQNGKVLSSSPKLKTACGGRHRQKRDAKGWRG